MPRQDDVDDFMASIFGGQAAAQPQPQWQQPVSKRRAAAKPRNHPQRTRPLAPPKKQVVAPATERTKHGRLPRTLIFLPVLALTIVGGYFLWQGPISALLQPKSPFSSELQESMGVPLYFPTELPDNFKIETDGIPKQGSLAVIYAITNDEGKRITVTLQKQPKNLNETALYSLLKDIREVPTKFGEIKLGTSIEDNVTMANVLTGQTWVIIRSTDGSLTPEALALLVNSLKY